MHTASSASIDTLVRWRRVPIILCFIGLTMPATVAFAGKDATVADDTLVDLVVTDAWARETPPGAVSGAAYMTIVNNGANNWVLEGLAGDIAKRVELHSHIDDDGVMRMRPVDFIEIKPGVSVVLKPGGLHVMLIGINAPLKAGERFPLILKSKEGGDVQIQVEVRAPGGH